MLSTCAAVGARYWLVDVEALQRKAQAFVEIEMLLCSQLEFPEALHGILVRFVLECVLLRKETPQVFDATDHGPPALVCWSYSILLFQRHS